LERQKDLGEIAEDDFFGKGFEIDYHNIPYAVDINIEFQFVTLNDKGPGGIF